MEFPKTADDFISQYGDVIASKYEECGDMDLSIRTVAQSMINEANEFYKKFAKNEECKEWMFNSIWDSFH
jgi:hypothetical protein